MRVLVSFRDGREEAVGVEEGLQEEARAVRQPLDLADLAGDLVREPGPGRGFEEVESGVFIARLEEAEGGEPAVGAGVEPGQGGEAARVHGSRIDQDAGLASAPGGEEHRLLLILFDLLEKGPVPTLEHIPPERALRQVTESRFDLRALGQAIANRTLWAFWASVQAETFA